MPFLSRIAHTTPAQANRPFGFRFPRFSKSCRKELFQKVGSPEKVASNPISLALVAPRCAPTTCAKGSRRAFEPSAGGHLWKARDKPKAVLILDAAPVDAGGAVKKQRKELFK
jgi:hypothetical protein